MYRLKEKIFLPYRTKSIIEKSERIITSEIAMEILPWIFRDTFREAALPSHFTVLHCGIRVSSRNTPATVLLSELRVTPTFITFSGSDALLLSLSFPTMHLGPIG